MRVWNMLAIGLGLKTAQSVVGTTRIDEFCLRLLRLRSGKNPIAAHHYARRKKVAATVQN